MLVRNIEQIVTYGIALNTLSGLGAIYINNQIVEREREQQRSKLAERNEVKYNSQKGIADMSELEYREYVLRVLDALGKEKEVGTYIKDTNCVISDYNQENFKCI